MPVNWMDVSALSFNALLLLERAQLRWFPGWLPEPELGIALAANPAVAWYFRHKCPEIAAWVDDVLATAPATLDAESIRKAESAVLRSITDLLVYAVDPAIYDAQPFLRWDDRELTTLVEFAGQRVLDIGAGTGRLAFIAARAGATVYAVEPVANLRDYVKAKARVQGLERFYVVDGLITDIPFEDGFADIVMGGHVFGDAETAELAELWRVTRPGGAIILCPATTIMENARHEFLLAHGFAWAAFEEPGEGIVRKYWRIV